MVKSKDFSMVIHSDFSMVKQRQMVTLMAMAKLKPKVKQMVTH